MPLEWRPAHRVVSARQSPEAAFERIATADEAAALLRVIAAGRPPRIDPADVPTGTGSGWVMAAFLRGRAARFNSDAFGAFYAADSTETAVAETQFHYARFLRAAGEGYTLLSMRLLHAAISARPLDLRGRQKTHGPLYDPDPTRYAPAQAWATRQRARGADGVIYDSVRREAGECVALFRPRLITACRDRGRLVYEWDGFHFVATLQTLGDS